SCAAEIPISINVTGNATTSVKNYYGGIAGRIFRDGGTDRFVSVDKCYVNKLLSAVSPYDIYGGGILGLYHDKFSDSSVDDEFAGLEISECYNTGDISATGESVFCGGILGDALGTKGNKAKINMTIKGNMAFNVEIIIASTTTPSGVNRISGGENWTWSDPNKFKNYGLSEMTLIGLDGGVEGLPVLRTQINRIWFVNLNWDFASTWQWDDSLKRPVFQWR
ncbi:MAG: hypothetical protein LBV52_01615, partial [Spirochaetaceae bacterium]|nr:hypothetical protein [Spirochaetaceae bacterium]